MFFRSCPGAESRRRRPGGDCGRVWHDQHDNKGAKWKERARTEMMSSGLGRHLADGEHQDRVSLLMPSSSKCNLFLPLGHHRRPNLRKGRRQRDKQKLLQRLLSGFIPTPIYYLTYSLIYYLTNMFNNFYVTQGDSGGSLISSNFGRRCVSDFP